MLSCKLGIQEQQLRQTSVYRGIFRCLYAYKHRIRNTAATRIQTSNGIWRARKRSLRYLYVSIKASLTLRLMTWSVYVCEGFIRIGWYKWASRPKPFLSLKERKGHPYRLCRQHYLICKWLKVSPPLSFMKSFKRTISPSMVAGKNK